jgi:acetylornithine deacetylase/succinyl-diaminopimelate desuccinylase-like protein
MRAAGSRRVLLGSAVVTDLPKLDLSTDVLALTRALVDAPSVSGAEGPLADAVEAALRGLGALEVERVGDTVLAGTSTPSRSPTTCPPSCGKSTGYSGCTDVAPAT